MVSQPLGQLRLITIFKYLIKQQHQNIQERGWSLGVTGCYSLGVTGCYSHCPCLKKVALQKSLHMCYSYRCCCYCTCATPATAATATAHVLLLLHKCYSCYCCCYCCYCTCATPATAAAHVLLLLLLLLRRTAHARGGAWCVVRGACSSYAATPHNCPETLILLLRPPHHTTPHHCPGSQAGA